MKKWILHMAVFSGIVCSHLLQAQITHENRELQIRNFPCMKCHEHTSTSGSFSKSPHTGMKMKHMDSITQCDSCHAAENRDQLKLLSGVHTSFNDSQKLCAQCHGEKSRDWEKGIHGKQVGSWSHEKYRFTCVHCHDPHAPKFPDYVADPALPQKKKRGSDAH